MSAGLDDTVPGRTWTWEQSFAMRAALLYTLLWTQEGTNYLIALDWLQALRNVLFSWFNIYQQGGAGRRIAFWGHLVVGLLGALFWMLLDRKRKYEDKLYDISRVIWRFGAAQALMPFGANKIPGYHGTEPG